jgi:hypothetical protein
MQEFSSLPTQLDRPCGQTQLDRPWGQTNFFYESYVWLFLHGKRLERELAVQLHLKSKLHRQSFVSSILVRLDLEFNNDYAANIFTSLCGESGF